MLVSLVLLVCGGVPDNRIRQDNTVPVVVAVPHPTYFVFDHKVKPWPKEIIPWRGGGQAKDGSYGWVVADRHDIPSGVFAGVPVGDGDLFIRQGGQVYLAHKGFVAATGDRNLIRVDTLDEASRQHLQKQQRKPGEAAAAQ